MFPRRRKVSVYGFQVRIPAIAFDNASAGCLTDRTGSFGSVEHPAQFGNVLFRTHGGKQFRAFFGVDRSSAFRRCNDRARHGHRLQYLVLDAARNAQRRHYRGGMLQIRTDIGNGSGNYDLFACKRQDLGGRAATHDVETRVGPTRENLRKNLAFEPDDRIDIGQVVHGTGEDDWQFVGTVGRRSGFFRGKIVSIDAIAHRFDPDPAFRSLLAK